MSQEKTRTPGLVAETAEKLRNQILKQAPDTQIGSLNDLADALGVGIVTVQQAARILEHEGLLAVKRGPGGGYYGTRPDSAAIERAFATYLRVHDIGYREAFEMTILLDCDIMQAAAGSLDTGGRESVEALTEQLDHCESAEDRIQFELDLRETLFRIVERPLLELLARVAMQLYKTDSNPVIFAQEVGLHRWRKGRQRILHAILEEDEELAFFEAQRFRRMVREWTEGHDR